MPDESSIVAEQFDDAAQQHETARLGMWTFLATEILFFGGLFLAYDVYRHFYFADFAAASRHTDLVFGTVNSIIILTSSFTMALAVHAAKENYHRSIVRWLLATIALGTAFLVVKGFEYHKDITDHLVPGPAFNPAIPLHGQIFFWLYWTMTGLHAVHLSIGIGILSLLAGPARKGKFCSRYHTPLELAGLYWHFVDIIWLFLYPLLYLIQRHA
ncbi:MAG TPA: cytochrome c oxidase subunit 3 family protein [Desulfuromonadaceae bacterium]|nr:cytochrome c oxidase subunit 3 family protein [Desulfuromonadaceae bacterium]